MRLHRQILSTAIHTCLLAAALPVAAQEPANASEDSKQLETVTVTAQKREQQISEVPIAISAYTGDFLERNGLDNYSDLGALVPGVEVQFQSVANPSISIRGITADLNDPTQEPRISVFQDGVSMSRARGSFAVPFDLQRVEVLRGPQGTLFGRAAEIGALHFIQNKARDGFSAGFDVGFGAFDERRFTGHLNGNLSDTTFGRLAIFHHSSDGYVENLSGGDQQGNDTTALRGALHFDIGDAHQLDLIFNVQKDQPPGTAFRSMVIPNRQGSLDPYTVDAQRGEALGTDRDLHSFTGLGEFALNDAWSLSSITGWRRFDSQDKFDADGSQVALIEFDEQADGRQLSQEFRFNYDGGNAFTAFAGVSFMSEETSRDLTYQADERSLYALFAPLINASVAGRLTAQFQAPPFNLPLAAAAAQAANFANLYYPLVPLLNASGLPNTSVSSTFLPVPLLPPSLTNPLGFVPVPLNPAHAETFGNDTDLRATELFAEGTWKLRDAWELTVGLRATWESAEYGYYAAAGNGSSLGYLLSGRFPEPACLPTQPVCTNLLFPATAGRISAKDNWTSMVGRTVLRYAFNDDLSVYASISRGRRPAMLQVNDIEIRELPAEIVMSYEVGLKGATERLSYDLAAYYYDYDDFQAQVQNPTPPPFLVDANGGRAHAAGIEASLFARFSDHVNGYLNLAIADGGFNAINGDGTSQGLAGNVFRMFPKQTASAGLDWRIPMDGEKTFFIRPSVSYQSKVFFEDENNPSAFGVSFAGLIEEDAYTLFNLRAGMDFGEKYSLTISLENAFDEEYLMDAGNTGLIFGIPTLIAGAPRTWGVSWRGRF